MPAHGSIGRRSGALLLRSRYSRHDPRTGEGRLDDSADGGSRFGFLGDGRTRRPGHGKDNFTGSSTATRWFAAASQLRSADFVAARPAPCAFAFGFQEIAFFIRADKS